VSRSIYVYIYIYIYIGREREERDRERTVRLLVCEVIYIYMHACMYVCM
jgi:hypothetical protein